MMKTKVLLAVDKRNDPQVVCAYLADRFRAHEIEIDVLNVLPSEVEDQDASGAVQGSLLDASQAPGSHHECASNLVSAFLHELRDKHGLATVRTHVEYGDAATVIIACSKRWHSSVILIEAPKSRGLLTACRFDGVTRRLLARASCPVELLRNRPVSTKDAGKVMVPVALEQLASFPFSQLQRLPLEPGSSLHLLGILPPPFDDSRLEASPAAIVKALHESRLFRERAEKQLEEVCQELAGELEAGTSVQFEVVEGCAHDCTSESARRLQASLVVMSMHADHGFARSWFSRLAPEAIALSSISPVMLLKAPEQAVAGECEQAESQFARLSSR
jgi:nucleotide-binding universal stress UspA family protein